MGWVAVKDFPPGTCRKIPFRPIARRTTVSYILPDDPLLPHGQGDRSKPVAKPPTLTQCNQYCPYGYESSSNILG